MEIRKGRTRDGYTQVHHEWFDVYIPVVGTEAFMVWCMLSRYVNRDPDNALCGRAYPGRDLVCKTLKIGPATFTKAINTLHKYGLLDIAQLQTGKYVYTVHDPLPKAEAEAVLFGTGSDQNRGRFYPEQGAVLSRTGGGSDQNTKEIKEKDKDQRDKGIVGEILEITKESNPDNQPAPRLGRKQEPKDPVQRGIPLGLSPASWKAPDLLRHFKAKWREAYGSNHPAVNHAVECAQIKRCLLDVYGPEKSKGLIDQLFARRQEFENPEYPSVSLSCLRQEWLVRKLLASPMLKHNTPKLKTGPVSRKRFMIWHDATGGSEADFLRSYEYDPEQVEWVD